jgi:flagellar biosynthetic protein FliR
MDNEALLPAAVVAGFLMVLARVGSALVFLPMPGLRVGPSAARSFFAFFLSMAVYTAMPRRAEIADVWLLAGQLLAEAGFGLAVGLLVNVTVEALLIGMQLLSVQAGYSYASTIDPTTQAESGVLIILAQLVSGVLFFSLGLDRLLLLAFARSFASIPPGGFRVSEATLATLGSAGASMFSNGLLVVAPVIALVLLADLALALTGRLHTQLQVMSF